MNKQQCPNELDWVAFCYAAGELDPAEAEQFESRLADDQTAREALARAVELTQAVAVAESETRIVTAARHVKTDWSTRLSWMAIGGLAAGLLGLLWSGAVTPPAKSRQLALAAAWTDARHQVADVLAPEAIDDELAATMPAYDLDEDQAPSWMMAALYMPEQDDNGSGGASNEGLEN